MAFPDVQPYIPEDYDFHDFHAVTSVMICELAHDGFFDLTREDWDFGPKYSAEQHAQLCQKITEHFWFREIALTPPGIWKREFLRKLNEIMPKYMPLYEALDNGIQVGTEGEYYKSRNIFSDFPQTALQGDSQDYASTGNDVEYERIRQLDPIVMEERIRSYDDVDMAIIRAIDPLFSCLLTVNVNGY